VKLKPIKLVNAQEMARQYPNTFEAPPRSALRKLGEGDLVKVSNNAERFWIQIMTRSDDVLIGRVDNFLLAGDVSYDDLVQFHECNVFDIYEGER
jgi:hypothetical protein